MTSEINKNNNVSILIVEDSRTQAEQLRFLLEQHGYKVTAAVDGKQALQAVSAQKPDLVISDIMMPEMNGYELCKAIKSDETLKDIPVILVTALSDAQDVIRGLECGADNFILKPYNEDYLLSRVQFMLLNNELRQTERLGTNLEIFFNGQRHFVTSGRLQILNLLLSTYEAAILQNKQLTQARQSLSEGEQRLRTILNTVLDAFISMDEQGLVIDWNPEAERMFGYSAADAQGQILADLIIPPPAREAHRRGLKHFLNTGEGPILGKRIEITAMRADGREFPIELAIVAVRSEEGCYFNAFLHDITERKQAAEQLHDSALRLQTLFDAVVDGIITIDEHGIIDTMNPAAERIFGYTSAEVVGRNVNILMPSPYHSEHDGHLERYLATGEAHIIGRGREIVGLRKDGSSFPLELAVSEMRLGDGRYFIGIARDITARKQIEAQFLTARDEAQQASAAKSAFLAAMSHEIRTPMNGVIGMIDVLRQSSLRNYQLEMVDLIHESAYSLLNIIDDILDFSKIEADKLELESMPMSVADVVEKVCIMLDHLAEKKKVELTLFTDPELPAEVFGDAGRLRQMLINLANNAIKFSSGRQQSGQVSVRAMPAERRPDRVVVEIRIADNGIGMDEQTLSRLFSAFSQADVSTTRRFGGTGLGLAIVRHLVKLMGGEIEVQSAPDQGSTFTLRLPFVPVSDKPLVVEVESLIAGLSCLVVAESSGLADDVAIYLSHGGATVVRLPNLASVWAWNGPVSPGLWIWVVDVADVPAPLDELRALARTRPEQEIRFVVIERGRRHKSRREDIGMMMVDGNVLTRELALKTVAIAAGRMQEEKTTPPPGKTEMDFSPPSRAAALRQGRLILVAEDNETNRKVVLRQLALLGFAADVVNDGRQALECWQSGDYALLLTDLHMPELDGYELTAAIRAKKEGTRHVPIVALTATALQGEAERCRAVGMDDYLSKPVQLAQLKAMLEKWLPTAVETGPDLSDLLARPLDVSVLKALVGDDPAVIREFLHDFRTSATQIAMELRDACEHGQAVQAGALAHKLKSSARAVGALALGEICAEMEQAGKAGQVQALTALLSRFEAEMAVVNAYLDTL